MLTLCLPSSVPRYPTIAGRSNVEQQKRAAVGISTGVLNNRTMAGLFGEPKNVPTGGINFFPCQHLHVQPFVKVTGSSDFFFLDGEGDACGGGADIDLVTSFKLLPDKKPRKSLALPVNVWHFRAWPP